MDKKVYSIKEAKQDLGTKPTIGEFCLTMLHQGTNSHIIHLQTKSRTEHKILQKFYRRVVEKADDIIEMWQGVNAPQIIEYPDTWIPPLKNGLDDIMRFRKYMEDNRDVLGDDSGLQNQMDDMMELINAIVYKESRFVEKKGP